jgi:hypothetical protein
MRRVQLLDQARLVDLGGNHGQRRLAGLFVGLLDRVLMFLDRGSKLRQRGLGRRYLTLGVKLSNAGVTQGLILLRLVASR